MKRKIWLCSCVLALAALISMGTFAYYATEDTATNVVTAGNVKIALNETTADGSAYPAGGVPILPGDTIDKIVTVKNTGSHPCYVRVELKKNVDSAALTAEDCIHMDIDTEAWTYRDGYYYYNTPLAAGETTSALFTQVRIDGKNVDNAYLGKTLALDITAYAVQSENNGDAVLDAAGWPDVKTAEGGDDA